MIGLLMLALAPASETDRVVMVVDQVRSALERLEKDGQTAKAVSRWKLGERLEDRVVEELESLGAGPKTVAELLALRDATSKLELPVESPVFPHDPPPSAQERELLIGDARANALNYVRSLPDFVCNQVVRRYENLRGTWLPKDTLEVKLTFFEAKETYQLRTVNGRFSNRSYREVGGAITEGEFGTLLAHIFSAEHKAEISWHHWSTLRKHEAHVLQFRLPVASSSARLEAYRPGGGTYNTVVGQHGYVYVDRNSHSVLRIIAEADSLPARFPIRTAITTMDYDFSVVGGREFLLPLRAEVRMTTADFSTRNEVVFRDYRKYATESKITFDEPK
jgi:hypothetical protein